jgi:hypothetical protein
VLRSVGVRSDWAWKGSDDALMEDKTIDTVSDLRWEEAEEGRSCLVELCAGFGQFCPRYLSAIM